MSKGTRTCETPAGTKRWQRHTGKCKSLVGALALIETLAVGLADDAKQWQVAVEN